MASCGHAAGRYLLEHPEIEDTIPDNSMIELVPEYDQELVTKNIELAKANKELGQTIIFSNYSGR